MQGLTENHILWRGLPVKISYLLKDSLGLAIVIDYCQLPSIIIIHYLNQQ